MIEVNSIVSCIEEDEYNIDILNLHKKFTYLCKEVIIEEKVNNNIINNKSNFNNNKIKYYNNKNKVSTTYLNNKKVYNYDAIILERTYFLRNKKIKKYRKHKELLKKNIRKKEKRHKEILNLMKVKIKKMIYLKNNNKIKL